MDKIYIDKQKEVVVQKAWLESLLKYADDIELGSPVDFSSIRIKWASLYGYISSAKFILGIENKQAEK